MSAHRLRLVLTELAENDIQNIEAYTLQVWGSDQVARYETALDLALETLRGNPSLGRPRDDLLSGLRGYPVFRHTIYYLVDRDTLVVERVLHQRMDTGSAFAR